MSFSRLPKGASTGTNGFTCSLQFEIAKFVFHKLVPYCLVRRGIDLYVAAWEKKKENFFSKLFGTQQRGTLRCCVALIKLSCTPHRRALQHCVGMLRCSV